MEAAMVGRLIQTTKSDYQLSFDFQAIVAYAACAGAGSGDRLPRSQALHLSPDQGIDKVRFLAPVPAGARVRLRVVLAGVEPRDGGQVIMKTQNTLEVEGSEKPALIAETLALLIPATGGKT
jgi:acyl dehydratase